MFDIGFIELLVIAVVSLLVIGPERLPEAVRTVSMWIGRFKRSLRETRQEIEQQLGTDEIRRQLHNEDIMRNLEKMRSEMETLKKEVHLESELYLDGERANGENANDDNADPEISQATTAEESSTADSKPQTDDSDSLPPEQKQS